MSKAAEVVFRRAFAKFKPSTVRKARVQAAERLVREVGVAAKDAGFLVHVDDANRLLISPAEQGVPHVYIGVDDSGGFELGGTDDGAYQGPLPVAFDAGTRAFVSTEDPKSDPVAALATLLTSLFKLR